MPYQNSGYQNVPTNEDQQNQEMRSEPPPQQQSYHSGPTGVPNSSNTFLPSYHQYMYNQQGVYDDFAAMGSYGPNVGELAEYARRVRKNRRRIGFIVAAFVLVFLLPHHAKKQRYGTHSTSSISDTNDNPDSFDTNPLHSGIAGDGDHWVPQDSSSSHNTYPSSHDTGSTSTSNGSSSSSSSITPNSDPNSSLKLAYLLAFPRSGTSYVMRLVEETTNTSLAVNYGVLAKMENNQPLPVYRTMDQSNQQVAEYGSPFFGFMYSNTRVPQKYILTLTHCGGICMYPCTLNQYIKTEEVFEEDCRLVMKDATPINLENVEESITPRTKIGKLVHLIRDPFSNVVSRFHAYADFNSEYTNDEAGFQKYCSDMDSNQELSEMEALTNLISDEIKLLLKNVPCHAEFYRYIAWHNHVTELSWNWDYPTLNVFYEDLDSPQSRSQQAVALANFLETPMVDTNKGPEGLVVANYRNFFTQAHQAAIETLTRTMAFTKTMTLLERYFQPLAEN